MYIKSDDELIIRLFGKELYSEIDIYLENENEKYFLFFKYNEETICEGSDIYKINLNLNNNVFTLEENITYEFVKTLFDDNTDVLNDIKDKLLEKNGIFNFAMYSYEGNKYMQDKINSYIKKKLSYGKIKKRFYKDEKYDEIGDTAVRESIYYYLKKVGYNIDDDDSS
jgi:hypothetical protein